MDPNDPFADLIPSAPARVAPGDPFADLIPAAPAQPAQGNFLDPLVGQGLLMGFGDEMKGAARAGLRKLRGEDHSFGDIYRAERDAARDAYEAFAERNPKTSMGLEIGGALAPAVATMGAATPAVAARGAAAGAGAAARRGALAGVGTGAVEGAIVGAGKADEMEDVTSGAITGGALGAAGGAVVGGAVGGIAGARADRARKAAVPSRGDLETRAQAAYNRADASGLVLASGSVQGMASNIARRVRAEGIDRDLHPKASAVMRRLLDAGATDMPLRDLDTLRKVVRQAAGSIEPAERRIGSIMVEELDGYLDNLAPRDVAAGNADEGIAALREARATWHAKRKADTLDELFERARNADAGFERGLRVAFRSLANNPKRMRQFSPEEQEAILGVVREGASETALRAVAKLSPTSTFGQLSTFAAGGAAVGVNPLFAAAPIAGLAAQGALNRGTRRAAEQVGEMVRGSAPAPGQAATVAAPTQAPAQAPGVLPAPSASPATVNAPSGAPRRSAGAFTPGGQRVDVEYQVVEADDLIASNRAGMERDPRYLADLQPRDRTRAALDMQVQRIGRELEPELVGRSASTADGAPIVGPDGMVESGNGRALGILRAYGEGGERATAYRQFLTDEGFDVEGMRQPVLVRRRTTEMDDAARVRFAQEAGRSPVASTSASERAAVDASRLDGRLLDLYRGGPLDGEANGDFVTSVMRDVIGGDEANGMVNAFGQLSVEGRERIQGALVRSAYDDPSLVTALMEDGDEAIAGFGGALKEAAGEMARLRSKVQDGSVSPEADLSGPVRDAVRLVRLARQKGQPIRVVAAQGDIEPVSDEAAKVLQLAFGRGLKGRFNRERFLEALSDVAREAERQTTDARLFGDPLDAGSLLDGALERASQRQQMP